MAFEQVSQDQIDCTRLCVDFAHHLDARRYDAVLDLFTDEGTFERLGTIFTGREEISRFLQARPVDMVTRHLCTNIRIVLQSTDQATGVCYVLFLSGKARPDGELPVTPSLPAVVEYHDAFSRTNAGWRIAERRVRPVFG
jgi:3-phenylpropionate/cinnamic acid dioxygenase small subunit